MTNREMPSLQNWLADPYRNWDARFPGRRGFGYLCTYAPLELLHAAGFTPVRLMQLPGPISLADAYIPSFSCALARTMTERMVRGQLRWLQGVLFVHTCDTMQCLADIWRLARPGFQVIPLSMPTVLSHPRAQDYWLAELHGLAALLQSEFGSAVLEEPLRASIVLYNQQRRLLAALYERADSCTAEQRWALTTASMLMPVEEHIALLHSFLDSMPIAGTADDRPAIVLVGAILDDPTILRLIEELGGRVVGDDLCTGSRFFQELVDETGEPFVALAERYVRRASCPAKHNPAQPHGQRLLQLVHDTAAKGVIFVLPKFCDPHAFEYLPLHMDLARAGVPHVLIETDVTLPMGQLRTRLQAFLEMLR